MARWARNGRELYFRNGDNGEQVWAVDISSSGGDFVASKPTLLFTGPYALNHDVARDGRFLMIKPEPQAVTQLNVVENCFEENSRRVD